MCRIFIVNICLTLYMVCLTEGTFDITNQDLLSLDMPSEPHLENLDPNFVPHDDFEQDDKTSIFYFGNKSSHTKRVAESSKILTNTAPQDYFVVLTYPAQYNKGVRVSLVKAAIEITSNQTRAYIVSGGLNENQIQIGLKAWNTSRFAYTVTVYSSATQTKPILYSVGLLLAIFAWNKLVKL